MAVAGSGRAPCLFDVLSGGDDRVFVRRFFHRPSDGDSLGAHDYLLVADRPTLHQRLERLAGHGGLSDQRHHDRPGGRSDAAHPLPGRGRDVKIVAVTASAFAEQQQETLAAGMDDFVRKPFRAVDIFDCLAKHLGVRYVYGQTVQTNADPALSPEAIAKLPESLRKDLADGLILGNVERLAHLMVDIEPQNADLSMTGQ